MIKVKVSIKDDRKKWDEFRARMRDVHGSHVTVGVHEDAGTYSTQDAPSVGEVALWNEFGTRTIPERSFLRSAIDGNMDKINTWRVELLEEMTTGKKSLKQALDSLGFRVQVLVQNRIKSGVPPANAPSTLAQKKREGVGSSTLQWTRLLLRSIGFKSVIK